MQCSWRIAQSVVAALFVTACLCTRADAQAAFDARPIDLGVSGGNIKLGTKRACCTGTLGALVQDNNGTQYILSNNHVLGRVNQAKPGEAIIQPGLADQNPTCFKNTDDAVAYFSRSITLSFKPRMDNVADASIAQVVAGDVSPTGFIAGIGNISGTVESSPTPGELVQKTGRTTGYTEGVIQAVNVSLTRQHGGGIRYTRECHGRAGVANFINQIAIVPIGTFPAFSMPGDSGSLIVNVPNAPAGQTPCPDAIGLLFAGNNDNSITFANPIWPVLNGLGVSIVPGCVSTSAMAASANVTSGTPLASSSAARGVANSAMAVAVTRATRVRDRHKPELRGIPQFIGSGIGRWDETNQAAIVVYVEKDTPQMRAAMPADYEGIPVRVVVSGPISAQ
ncbi:MAG: hypothetical protein ACREQE_00715 [Candidatus Binataceae bacterium]